MNEEKETVERKLNTNTLLEGANVIQHSLQKIYNAYDRKDKKDEDLSAAAACIDPLLKLLEWVGSTRQLKEVMPHFDTLHTVEDLRSLLVRLNYKTQKKQILSHKVKQGQLPALMIGENNEDVRILIDIADNGKLLVYNGKEQKFAYKDIANEQLTLYIIEKFDPVEANSDDSKFGWFQSLLSSFKSLFLRLFALTFAINLLDFGVPFYIMMVYDKVIGNKSFPTLVTFIGCLLLAISLSLVLRQIRSQTIAYLGARVQGLVTLAAFKQVLSLPILMSEGARSSEQLSRFKQFVGIRDIFMGHLGSAILDAPFIVVFLAAIFIIGGNLGFLSLALLCFYIVTAIALMPLGTRFMKISGNHKKNHRNFVVETIEKHETVMDNNSEHVWMERENELSAKSLVAQFKAQQFQALLQNLSQLLVMVTGILTIGLGAGKVIEGTLSAGALIALVTLIWRLLSPIQTVFLGIGRINATLGTFKQINNLMRLKSERVESKRPNILRNFTGQITMDKVGFRHQGAHSPSIFNFSINIAPREFIAITGDSGSGKTVLLKLMAGLYTPQTGVVGVDGLNLRQIDSYQYRRAIGYVSQEADFFHGTIAQNLMFANPVATLAELERALDLAGAREIVEQLPEGIETRLNATLQRQLTKSFSSQLSLARAYLTNNSIYMFDDPGSDLDPQADKSFMEALKTLQKTATVILATQRPSHMYLADRVLLLKEGQLLADADPEKIVPQILKAAQTTKAG
jgi:ABC-type bacteriocin/lantibiotic exporter with double-glycine peptidase domain